jgi:hypothetical protein
MFAGVGEHHAAALRRERLEQRRGQRGVHRAAARVLHQHARVVREMHQFLAPLRGEQALGFQLHEPVLVVTHVAGVAQVVHAHGEGGDRVDGVNALEAPPLQRHGLAGVERIIVEQQGDVGFPHGEHRAQHFQQTRVDDARRDQARAALAEEQEFGQARHVVFVQVREHDFRNLRGRDAEVAQPHAEVRGHVEERGPAVPG